MNTDLIYWIILSAGILLSAGLFVISARRSDLPAGRAAGGFAAGLVLACLFAKGLYVLLNLTALLEYGLLEKWFRTDPREFSFVAGGIGFCLGPVLVSLKNRESIPRMMDQLAIPGCVLAAAVRFGEIFFGELGLADPYTIGLPDIPEGGILARFPFAVCDDFGIWYLAVSTLSAILFLGVAVYLFYMKRKSWDPASGIENGVVFERGAFLLCCVPFLLETMRMESLIFYFVHVDQVLCALVMLAMVILSCRRVRKHTGHFPKWPVILTLACIAVNGITQYLMDKPWQFEQLMPEGLFLWITDHLKGFGYTTLLLTAVALIVLFLLLGRKVTLARREAKP